jgi:hypothetical protein
MWQRWVIAAVGVKTSIPAVMRVGPKAALIVRVKTLFLLSFIFTCVLVPL